ncbi:MAG: hypothetical protein KKG59_02195 [Nanoarchaeota archaeon]|nr:hypothetical protein [Nanoarchaeota archaeon]
MKKETLNKEMRIDDQMFQNIKNQIADDKEIANALQKEQEINEQLAPLLEKEEVLDEEIKVDSDISHKGNKFDRFFVKRDKKKAKKDKKRLSSDLTRLLSKREEIVRDLQTKMVAKLKREGMILKETEEREGLEA